MIYWLFFLLRIDTYPSRQLLQEFVIEMNDYRQFNWTYASLVYSDSEYGLKGYESLTAMAQRYGVCFAAQIRVGHQFTASDYDRVIKQLRAQSQARVVVLFSDKATAMQVMAATKRAGDYPNPPIWVGCDGWSSRELVTQGLHHQFTHLLT